MAKQIKKSKFHGEPDKLAENGYGEGAIRRTSARLVVRGGAERYDSGTGSQVVCNGMWGSIVGPNDITGGDPEFQMWDCEVIIIPKRKYRKGFRGYRADQVLCANFADPNSWEEQIFGPPHPEDREQSGDNDEV